MAAQGYNYIMQSEVYSVREAANRMGISERHLRLLLDQGKVKGKKLGRDWVVLGIDYERKRRPKGVLNERINTATGQP
jgi:excisionase family DNA binding protein